MTDRPYHAAEHAHYAQRLSPVLPLPPPLPRDGQTQTFRTRPGFPPLLTTDINSPSAVLLSASVSTTSLHGPFSRHIPHSPGPSPRGTAPMASRTAVSYTAPYNPREWVGGSRRTSLIEPLNNDAEAGIANPPPPYSGPPAGDFVNAVCVSAGSTLSPADSTFTAGEHSQINTPTSTIGLISPSNPGPPGSSDNRPRTNSSTTTQQFNPLSGHSNGYSNRAPQGDSRPPSALGMTRTPIPGPLSITNVAPSISYASTQHGPFEPHCAPAPPSARRAASAGAVSSHGSSYHTRDTSMSRSSSRQGSWFPGMPLPGPPPGPPPSSSRSQSVSGMNKAPPLQNLAQATRVSHRRPLRAPILSPLPPTPANWRDASNSRSSSRAPPPLHIETANLDQPESSSAGLSRSAALRVSSAKGLLERRKHRRSAHEETLVDGNDLTIDTDLWFNTSSPEELNPEDSNTFASETSAMASPAYGHRTTTPGQRLRIVTHTSIDEISQTSVNFESTNPFSQPSHGHNLPQKALPTPPLSQKNPLSAHSVMPSAASSMFEVSQGDSNSFLADASRRHHEFLLLESQAKSDLERLELFTNFVCIESKIRARRYPVPFTDSTFDVEGARRRLFEREPETKDENFSRIETPKQVTHPLPYGFRAAQGGRNDANWWKDYRPALSPIASMDQDELSSRGRTPSRWWQSQTGDDDSQGVGPGKKVKRSKRESKYMGLPALTLDEVLSEADTPTAFNDVMSTDVYRDGEKANPETFGYYDDGYDPVPTMDPPSMDPTSPNALDISRFITLPPPYPRHYPAVNNSHPKLAASRNTVRTLSQLTELEDRRSRHNLSVEALRSEHKRKIQERQAAFKANIQAQIGDGSISYAEAAEAEQALKLEEHRHEKSCLQAEFDTLQDVVINPMHDMLNTRLEQLNASIVELTDKLEVETQVENLDRPQQEGDAMPEILEYLTQLKWLFETREQIHQEIFNLLSERNEKYKAIVLLPYRQVSHLEKVRDTEDFFHRDSLQRKTKFRQESVDRYQKFLRLVEKHVGQEVVLQLSAFWDIAPGLLDLLQKVPDEMDYMQPIAIPAAEYEENPAYRDFPLQYLYTLLDHAEKSTYQFIESQVNLHCLLHEVKLAEMKARCRAAEAGQTQDSSDITAGGEDPVQIREKEEADATASLKQQVAMVEQQWTEALGSALQAKKNQVKMHLECIGGWDESLQETL